MTQWEYADAALLNRAKGLALLQDRGKQGWELVSIIRDSGVILALFKRPLVAQDQQQGEG